MITAEIFPTNASCAAGCNTCPLSKRPGEVKNTSVNPDVLKSFRFFEKTIKSMNQPYDFLYAGSIDLFSDHLKEMISDPKLINLMGILFDPKDLRSFPKQAEIFKEQKDSILANFPGLSLNELVLTIYPKNPFRVSKKEQDFILRLFREMKDWKSEDKIRLVIEMHANMINPNVFSKKIPFLERNDSQLYESIGRTFMAKELPDLFQKVFYFTNWLGVSFNSSFSLGYFRSEVTKSFNLKNRLITSSQYPKEWTRHKINVEQAALLLLKDYIEPGFSFSPEGVMMQHSSVMVMNPVIWISHEEFRENIFYLMKDNVPLTKDNLRAMSIRLLKSNLELFKLEKHYITPKNAMIKFRELRKKAQK
jgi:hypothetical protein